MPLNWFSGLGIGNHHMNPLVEESTAIAKRRRNGKAMLSKRMPRVGRVVFSQESSPVHCAVKEFSETRAILTMSGWLGLPSEFTLYVEPDSVRARCKVVRCSGSNVEVEFSDIEENVRFRSNHASAA